MLAVTITGTFRGVAGPGEEKEGLEEEEGRGEERRGMRHLPSPPCLPTSGASLCSSFQGRHEPSLAARCAGAQPSTAPPARGPPTHPRIQVCSNKGEIHTIPQWFQVLINCLRVYLNLTMNHSDLFNQGKLSVPGSVFISL